ncbi:unnamed protein product [Cunninghamella blakesleeana]
MVAENVTKGLSPDFLPVPTPTLVNQGQQDDNNSNNESPSQRTVVIAYDHSENSDATFAKGIRLGLISPKDKIHIVHIINQRDYHQMLLPAFTSANYSVSGTGADYSFASNDNYSTLWDSINEEFMIELKKLLHKNGFENVITESIRGDPKESMVDYCNSCRPNFLICSSRGLGAIKKYIYINFNIDFFKKKNVHLIYPFFNMYI